MIAALYVNPVSVYASLGCDTWAIARDARTWSFG